MNIKPSIVKLTHKLLGKHMEFALKKEQEMIRKSLREFFSKSCPKDLVRELKDNKKGYDPKIWKKMLQLGYQGIIIPEIYGGLEGDFLELMIFMEEAGRNIVPSPFFTTVVQCGLPLNEFGSEEQKKTYLTGIAEKGEIWSLANTEKAASEQATDINLTATVEGSDYLLNGEKLFVSYANSAQYFLVSARTGSDGEKGISLFIVNAKDQRIDLEFMPTTAHDQRYKLTFNQTRIPKENMLGDENSGWDILQKMMQYAAIMKAAEMSGGAEAALMLTTNYTKERKQFGKPLGSFQAIQHRLVDLLTQVEGLKHLVHKAIWQINEGNSSDYLISVTKAKANTVYHNVCHHGVIMHGAIGWTEEMDIGLYHIRSRANITDGGGTHQHKNIIASALKDFRPACATLYT